MSACKAASLCCQLRSRSAKGYRSFCSRAAAVRDDNIRPSTSNSEETDFGYRKVLAEKKQHHVNSVFSNVATRYDLMNDVMSLGVHRRWKDCFVESLRVRPGHQILDVAGGTGDIAFRLQEKADRHDIPVRITVSDINEAMLDEGRRKAGSGGKDYEWVVANAEQLPFESNSFDLYTIAFGIRNCTHLDKVLNEAHRVLKPGGQFACLEFSPVDTPLLSQLYDAYSF